MDQKLLRTFFFLPVRFNPLILSSMSGKSSELRCPRGLLESQVTSFGFETGRL